MLSRLVSDHDATIAPLDWGLKGRSRPHNPAGAASGASPGGAPQQQEPALEQKLRQAYEAGLAEGRATALESANQEVRSAVERLAATTAEVAEARNEMLRRAEADIVRLSIEIARRILHRELAIDTSALDALIRAALEKLQSQEVYRVRVHPDLEQTVRACLQQLGRYPEIEVTSDVTQPRGGAIFEMNRGALDASLETQVREIERMFEDHLGDR